MFLLADAKKTKKKKKKKRDSDEKDSSPAPEADVDQNNKKNKNVQSHYAFNKAMVPPVCINWKFSLIFIDDINDIYSYCLV